MTQNGDFQLKKTALQVHKIFRHNIVYHVLLVRTIRHLGKLSSAGLCVRSIDFVALRARPLSSDRKMGAIWRLNKNGNLSIVYLIFIQKSIMHGCNL